MKELKLYQCELCGTQYKDKKEAQECEKNHVKDFEIVKRAYREPNGKLYRFPVKIWAKSKDGEERMYELCTN